MSRHIASFRAIHNWNQQTPINIKAKGILACSYRE
jgi:hypothetical protein